MIEYPQFFDLLCRRYSCRKYDNAAVSREMLMAIMEAARFSQSACNKQPWKFLIIDEPELKDVVFKSYDRDWIRDAGAFVVVLGNKSEAWKRGYDGRSSMDIDIAIACENICLATATLGLGACWIGNFDVNPLIEGLSIPEEWEPVAIISIGYPKDPHEQPEKKRKNIDEIVKWGKF